MASSAWCISQVAKKLHATPRKKISFDGKGSFDERSRSFHIIHSGCSSFSVGVPEDSYDWTSRYELQLLDGVMPFH